MIGIHKEIRPNTPLHQRIVEGVKCRRDMSVKKMRNKYPDWRKAEEMHSGYVWESAKAARVRAGREVGTEDFTNIKVSMSYATAMSMHTYWTSVFLARNPVFQVTARHGEPEMAVQGVEALLDYQLMAGRQLVPYYAWLLDVAKFGIGFLWNWWDEEYTVATKFQDVPVSYLGIPIPGQTRRARITEKVVNYQGSKVFNVRPYEMRIDPRVDMQNYQKGEFMGRKIHLTWTDLVAGEADKKYFNVEEVRKRRLAKWIRENEQVGNQIYPENDLSTGSDDMDIRNLSTMEGEEMVIMIQPDKWGLGKTNYPEKWVFTIVEDEIVVGCRPLGCYHGMFPCAIMEYEMDHGLLFRRGVHDILKPMDDTLNWLVNTHFYNIRRVLNDQLVVDPQKVVMKDLLDNKPGKIIRLKPSAYGEDVRTAVHQLQVADVTNQHLADTQLINELSHKMVGINDNLMGMIHPGGRKTATEIRTSAGFGINRLKTNSEFFSAAGWTDNFIMMLSNTQQYYDQEKVFKVAGELGAQMQRIQITPESIAGQYDFVPVDGTMPIDRFAQANLWKELFTALSSMTDPANPGPPFGFDLGKIFAYTAQLAGAKNINQFKVDVVPDEELGGLIERGNVRPITGASGTTTSEGGIDEGAGGVSGAGQVSGVGPTG